MVAHLILSPYLKPPSRMPKLHIIPASELLSPPNAADSAAIRLSPNISTFAALFRTGHEGQAAVFIDAQLSISMPTDVDPNLVASRTSAATQPAPSASSSPSPPAPPPPGSPSTPPPSPRSPSPPLPPPWWVTDAALAPVAKHLIGAAALASSLTSSGSWAVEVTDPRPGTLLVSRAAPAAGQEYFKDALILLVKVCHCSPSIFGVLLSAPAPSPAVTVGHTMLPTVRAHLPAFVNHTLHMGGPAGPHMTVLHTASHVSGASQIQPGVYSGGCPNDAQHRVTAAEVSADDFTFYSGYAAWPIARLKEEVRQGKWGVVKASSDFLNAAIRNGMTAAAVERELL